MVKLRVRPAAVAAAAAALVVLGLDDLLVLPGAPRMGAGRREQDAGGDRDLDSPPGAQVEQVEQVRSPGDQPRVDHNVNVLPRGERSPQNLPCARGS